MTTPRAAFTFDLESDESPPQPDIWACVVAVIPCYNRPDDLRVLLHDLSRIRRRGVQLRIVVVDNASDPPLQAAMTDVAEGVEWIRSSENQGGAGGFNAGIAAVLQNHRDGSDYVWLLDSDVRLHQDALQRLVDVMSADPRIVAAGSELRDTTSGFSYEIGGNVCRTTGVLLPAARGSDASGLIACDYLAACSVLVRSSAIRSVGLLPECFLYNDDVEWIIALCQSTGGIAVGVTGSIVYHPWGRLPGIGRYYAARNAYCAMARLGLGRTACLRHALLDALFAVALSLLGLPRVAEAQIAGMTDAARGLVRGRRPNPGPKPLAGDVTDSFSLESLDGVLFDGQGIRSEVGVHPLLEALARGSDPIERRLARAYAVQQLPVAALQSGLVPVALGAAIKLLRRLLLGPRVKAMVVPLGVFGDWLRTREALVVAGDRVHVIHVTPWQRMLPTISIAIRGFILTIRIAIRRHRPSVLPPVRMPTDRHAERAC